MSTLDDKTLQRLHDGDLEGEERVEAEALLAESAEERQRLASLSQLGTLMRTHLGQEAEQAELDGLWDRVRAGIAEGPESAATPAPRSAWARFRTWLGDSMGTHPLRWVSAGVATVAVAVALTLLLTSAGRDTQSPPSAAVTAEPSDDVTIKDIDSPYRHPDIYQIKNGMRTTTVIWLHDDDELDGDAPGTHGADDGDDI